MVSAPQVAFKLHAIEWPTIILAAIIYSGWASLIYYHACLPTLLVMAIGAWFIAWHSSLQHEILHGHPTPSRKLNTAFAFAPLSLWLPYRIYRTSHLDHHRAEVLTMPPHDPESYYWSETNWAKLGPVARTLIKVQMTFTGRLLLGPAWNAGRLMLHEIANARSNFRGALLTWLPHLAGCAAIIIWVASVSNMSLWFYVFGIVYPGTSLSLIRSFAEHRASTHAEEQTAIVEKAKIFGLLFLFNNLHIVHHRHPELPWYRIPHWYHAHRDSLIAPEKTRVYHGYSAIALRFLFARFDDPVHPLDHEREGLVSQ